jgi:hypothetical protein
VYFVAPSYEHNRSRFDVAFCSAKPYIAQK